MSSSSHRLARDWAKRIAKDVGGEWTEFSYNEERADVIADGFTIEVKVRRKIPSYVRESIRLGVEIEYQVPDYLKEWHEQLLRYEEKYQKPCVLCWCEKRKQLDSVVVMSQSKFGGSVRWGELWVGEYAYWAGR